MDYEAHEWSCNETITADKLNNIEQGILEALNKPSGSDVLIIRQNEEASTSSITVYDKTWQQVFDALGSGQRVIIVESSQGESSATATQMILSEAVHDSVSGYAVTPYNAPSIVYIANSADGYLYRAGGK